MPISTPLSPVTSAREVVDQNEYEDDGNPRDITAQGPGKTHAYYARGISPDRTSLTLKMTGEVCLHSHLRCRWSCPWPCTSTCLATPLCRASSGDPRVSFDKVAGKWHYEEDDQEFEWTGRPGSRWYVSVSDGLY